MDKRSGTENTLHVSANLRLCIIADAIIESDQYREVDLSSAIGWEASWLAGLRF
jgi:hypothetical protein